MAPGARATARGGTPSRLDRFALPYGAQAGAGAGASRRVSSVTSTASVNTTTVSSNGNPVVGSYTQTAGAIGGTDAGNYSFAGYTTPTANYSITPAALTALLAHVKRRASA